VKRPLFLWGPVVLQMAIIFAASSIPDLKTIPGGVSDKTAHFWVYGILGLVLFRAFAGGALAGLTLGRAMVTIVLACLYGMSDEFHQSFVPGRSPDVFDVLADTVGAAAIVGVMLAARYLLVRRRSQSAAPAPPD
jgi:VanZ family protein